MASSSVGLAAIGIIQALGIVPISITRTQNKVYGLMKASAAHVIVSGTDEIALRARELTAVAGAHVAFDPVGGQAIASLLDAIANDGVLVWYGILSGEATPLPLLGAGPKSDRRRLCAIHQPVILGAGHAPWTLSARV